MLSLEKIKPSSLSSTLTFKGIALLVFGATVFPFVTSPVKNILVDNFPKQEVLIVNLVDIAGVALGVLGGGMATKGRIDAGGVYTPKGMYGPNKEDFDEPSEESIDSN